MMSDNDADDIVNVKPSGDAGRCTEKSSKREESLLVTSIQKIKMVTSIQKIKMVETSNVKVLLVVM